MPVVEVNTLADENTGPFFGPFGSRRYVRWYEVRTDVFEPGLTIVSHPAIPRQFVTVLLGDDADAYCVLVHPFRNPDDHLYWTVRAEFSTDVEEFRQGSISGGAHTPTWDENPMLRPPVFEVGTKYIRHTFIKDLDNRWIRNRAGDPYPPIVREIPFLHIHVERNFDIVDFPLLNYCNGAINDIQVGIWARRQVKFENGRAQSQFDQGVHYWRVSGDFYFGNDDLILNSDPNTGGSDEGWWYEWKLNAGYHKLVGGVLKSILTPSGQRPANPRPLAFDGTELAAGADPIFLAFKVLRDAPIHLLGLF